MKDEFLWEIGDSLSTMRLIIEGTVSLFENDAMPLTKEEVQRQTEPSVIPDKDNV